MTEFQVSAVGPVDFAPNSRTAEIIQNVRTILATPKGSVPLNRNFGLSTEALDGPIHLAKAEVTANAIKQIKYYEPRANVIKVTFEESSAAEGVLRPRVLIGVSE